MSRPMDKELATYRDLLDMPTEFREGFGWTTVVGIVFCGLVMLPGSIYLALMTGGNMTSAASWVTVILFGEVTRRALKTMNRQQLVVLLHIAHVMIAANILFPGGPFGQLVYRAYLVTSEAARDSGMTESFPSWFAPSPSSEAITGRNLFHADWIVPAALILMLMVIGMVKKYTLGYFFFRLTSDVENLPFPLAPIAAQGAMALEEAEMTAEDDADGGPPRGPADLLRRAERKKTGRRWRLFSLGATLGIAFGIVQVGVPAITGIFLDKPVFLIPLPFVDTTTLTQGLLPATPTGITIDVGIILLGMVLPFWAVLGTFIAIVATMLLNPTLHHFGILTRWQPGMNTVNTTFVNEVDFWMSFGIGAGLGIAVVCLYATIRDVTRKARELREKRRALHQEGRADVWSPPRAGRGDYSLGLALGLYCAAATIVVVVCYVLLRWYSPGTRGLGGILAFLIVFAFIYNPFISYVNARLLGIAGQYVDIPFVKETSFILSGAKGLAIWLAPIPVENYGHFAQSFRVNELTGVRFPSLIKAEIVALPILFILSGLFWGFIWRSNPIPSEVFPAAQVNWELAAKRQVLQFSSTFVPEGQDPSQKSIADSEFMKAIHPKVIGSGFGVTVALYVALSALGLPVLLVYGIVRGLGQLPHFMVLEVIGAFLGRFLYQRKYGRKEFLRMAPTILAGYFTGVGLIGMATIALKLIKEAVHGAPF